MARQPQRSEYSDLHTHCQAFTISGRIAMSAGQASAGFLFWAQRPQIAGMTATQKNCAAERSRSFFAQMPKGFEDIFFEKGGNQMKSRKKWRPGGRQRQSAAYHRKAVHERKRVVRLRVWKKGEKNGVVAEV